MKKLNGEPMREVTCSACEGTGLLKVKQPVQPGRKIYPPQCSWCRGKGRLTIEAGSIVR
jgi:DnaJ-class molecular chaperone